MTYPIKSTTAMTTATASTVSTATATMDNSRRRSTMISFPLRRVGGAHQPNLRQKLSYFDVCQNCDLEENRGRFRARIGGLEALRTSAINAKHDPDGCSNLKKYFGQLNYLKKVIPLHESSQFAASFHWCDILSESEDEREDIEFEMSSILYNIGALYTKLARPEPKPTLDQIKMSSTYFQCGAWVFQHLRHNYARQFSRDATVSFYSMAANICLAQGQECLLQKSRIESTADSASSFDTVRVALQIANYFQLALRTCTKILKDVSAELDPRLERVKFCKALKEWKNLMEFKIPYYLSMTYLYCGLESQEKVMWGECLTFFKTAKEKLDDSIRFAKSIKKTDPIHETLKFTLTLLEGKVAETERELALRPQVIPELEVLSADLEGASLVSPLPFKFDCPTLVGPSIFADLIAPEDHRASMLYREEKYKILTDYSKRIERRNEAMDKLLIGLNLDILEFIVGDSDQVPQEIIKCCKILKSKVDREALKSLSDLVKHFPQLAADMEAEFKRVDLLIRAENLERSISASASGLGTNTSVLKELQKQLGDLKARWTARSEKYQVIFLQASKTHLPNLTILLLDPLAEVAKHIIPSAGPSLALALEDIDADAKSTITGTKSLTTSVQIMRDEREKLEVRLRNSIATDDISNQVQVKGKEEGEWKFLFQEQLQKHNEFTQSLDDNFARQDELTGGLLRKNVKFSKLQKAAAVVKRERDAVIHSLLTSFEAYDELILKNEVFLKFHKELKSELGQVVASIEAEIKEEQERRADYKAFLARISAGALTSASASAAPAAATVSSSTAGLNSTGLEFTNANYSYASVTSVNGQNPSSNFSYRWPDPSGHISYYDPMQKIPGSQSQSRSQQQQSGTGSSNYQGQTFATATPNYSGFGLTPSLWTNTPNNNFYPGMGGPNNPNQVRTPSSTVTSASAAGSAAAAGTGSTNLMPGLGLGFPQPQLHSQPQQASLTSASLMMMNQIKSLMSTVSSMRTGMGGPSSNNPPATTNLAQPPHHLGQPIPAWNMGTSTSTSTSTSSTQNSYQPFSQPYGLPFANFASGSFAPPLAPPPAPTPAPATAPWHPPMAPNFVPTAGQSMYQRLASLIVNHPQAAAAGIVPRKGRGGKKGKAAAAAAAVMELSYESDSGQTPQPHAQTHKMSPHVTHLIPPQPPDWEASCDAGAQALTPFIKLPVPDSSPEFQVIFSMVCAALKVTRIERVVNVGLWKKFINTRKDLLCAKSDDLELLQGLGLSEKEFVHKAHASVNFDKSPGVLDYADNVALLYHCTRGNVDAVLSQGLDERLGSSTGLLGRGIYFADDPAKSMTYDGNQGTLMIFAVLLGDCCSVDHLANQRTFVREPEKAQAQRRNHTDLFFDSIVGRPAGVNEYVIYNRYQCCPLYVVSYQRGPGGRSSAGGSPNSGNSALYSQTRGKLPPFAWTQAKGNKKTSTPFASQDSRWPFYAQTIFELMAPPPPPPPSANGDGDGYRAISAQQQLQRRLDLSPTSEEGAEEAIAFQLSEMNDLGFADQVTNLRALERFGYNLERAVDFLLEEPQAKEILAAGPTAPTGAYNNNNVNLAGAFQGYGHPMPTPATATTATATFPPNFGPGPTPTPTAATATNTATAPAPGSSWNINLNQGQGVTLTAFPPTARPQAGSFGAGTTVTIHGTGPPSLWTTTISAVTNLVDLTSSSPSSTSSLSPNPQPTPALPLRALRSGRGGGGGGRKRKQTQKDSPPSSASTSSSTTHAAAATATNGSSSSSSGPSSKSSKPNPDPVTIKKAEGLYAVVVTPLNGSAVVSASGAAVLAPPAPKAKVRPKKNPAVPAPTALLSGIPATATTSAYAGPVTKKTRKLQTVKKTLQLIPHPLPTALPVPAPAATALPAPAQPGPDEEDCVICCVEYPTAPHYWQVLSCSHKLCHQCYSKLVTTGVTMQGVQHTFIKCPFCQSCSGQEIGTCPNGSMTATTVGSKIPGQVPSCNTISITYNINQGKYHLNRTAYLPNSAEGKRVLGLLKEAWDRRLIFTIGTSMTTGAQDTLVWNIHHKTAIAGGVQSHGYPDPTYLERVCGELKQYGLE